MIMFFGFPFSFACFLFSFGLLEIRIGIFLLFFCINSKIWHFFHRLSSTYSWEYYFTISKLFKHWTSWNCVPYAMVHRSVLQWTRGARVPLSLYERTFVAVLHFHFMTACYDCIPQTPGKSKRFLTFPNNHRRQSKVLFFLFLLYGKKSMGTVAILRLTTRRIL